MSLNFRPNHDATTRLANLRFYFHHLMVLFGFRPSISSTLRQCLLPSDGLTMHHSVLNKTLASVQESLPVLPTTAAYLIFSDGDRTITMEMDHHSAIVRSAEDFIAITNHDEAEELEPETLKSERNKSHKVLNVAGMTELVEESILRKRHAVRLWETSGMRSSRTRSKASINGFEEVVKLMNEWPITNEETHYAIVMDPKAGNVVWAKRYLEPSS